MEHWQNSGVPTSGSTGTGGYALSNLQGSYGDYYIFGVISCWIHSGTRTISCKFWSMDFLEQQQ